VEVVEDKEVHLLNALHDEHAVLPAEDRGADALVQQPDQHARHGVVVAPVHDLDSEHVEGPDQLAALWQVGHPRLQQDQQAGAGGAGRPEPGLGAAAGRRAVVLRLGGDLLTLGVRPALSVRGRERLGHVVM
jgi:hypothetical protein